MTMAYVYCIGTCYTCKGIFSFNPDLVPSIVIEGTREPVCLNCIETANPKRVANGLPRIEILPGAYDPEECA